MIQRAFDRISLLGISVALQIAVALLKWMRGSEQSSPASVEPAPKAQVVIFPS